MEPCGQEVQSSVGGAAMKIPERTGMWVEMAKSADRDDEITVQVPNGIWAGWMLSVRLKEEDVAAFLRSIGWKVEVPQYAGRAR
jgi:hypothetical protein